MWGCLVPLMAVPTGNCVPAGWCRAGTAEASCSPHSSALYSLQGLDQQRNPTDTWVRKSPFLHYWPLGVGKGLYLFLACLRHWELHSPILSTPQLLLGFAMLYVEVGDLLWMEDVWCDVLIFIAGQN